MVRNQRLHERTRQTAPLLVIAVVLVLSTVLAGCTGGGSDDLAGGAPGDGEGSGGNDDGGGGGDGTNGEGGDNGSGGDASAATYRYTEELLEDKSLETSGSFGPTEHCIPVHCFTGNEEGYTHALDLQEILPVGVPVQVDVELEQTTEYGRIDGSFRTETAVWNATPVSSYWYEDSVIVLLPDGNAKLHYVIEGGSPGVQGNTEWSLRVTATPMADQIPPGIPTTIHVEDPEAPPTIRSATAASGDYLLFDPTDELVGTFTSGDDLTEAFQEADVSGDYVVFPPWGNVGLVVERHVNASAPPPMQGLMVTQTIGEFVTAAPENPAEWSFEADPQPLGVGMLLHTENGYMNAQNGFRLESPAGVVVEVESICGFCTNLGGTSTMYWYQEGTHTTVTPGSYDAVYRDTGLGHKATHILWHHER